VGNQTLAGIRVIELAAWTFVPAAGAVLADWGADVIKVEHPRTGDPQRGLVVGIPRPDAPRVNHLIEIPNRGKRSIGLDIGTSEGREVLLKLVENADVFLTNLLPDSLGRARLTVEDLRARNPRLIYARGSGWGQRGDWATRGAYDSAAYWARAGIASMYQKAEDDYPPVQRPAFGDIMGGQTIAGGIAAALLQRERTGEASIVDVSLLGLGAWNLAPDVVLAGLAGNEALPSLTVDSLPNPLTNYYRTRDGRFVLFVMLQSDRYWPEVCELLGRPDLLEDPRFRTATDRMEHRIECTLVLRSAFAERTLDEWTPYLEKLEGVWAVVQTPEDLHSDPQVLANGVLRDVDDGEGRTFRLVANPVQFDETPPELRRAPTHGEHTEEICLEAGLDWDEIIALKESGSLL
jgi:crotonobetainyl-CoA:carnitine CoA-transferase CaiB-like acyl-CoA transferase